MTTKHTPRPWIEREGFIVGPDFETIADPRCLPPTDENIRTMDANARLIEAAPDYYAAAEAIRAHLVTSEPADDGSPNQVPRELLRDLLDAHRKADPTGYRSKK